MQNNKSIVLFDVSLRDGLQGANVNDYPTIKKKEIIDKLISDNICNSIEIGSIVSNKLLPIMSDTLELFDYVKDNKSKKFYVLIPPYIDKFKIAVDTGIKNMSFITSVSNEFQFKNTKKTIEETKEIFKHIFNYIESIEDSRLFIIKLYISCITHCPIKGKMDNQSIINEIIYYNNNYNFDELCLSDTMGNLSYDDFKYIIDSIITLGVDVNNISLHLHVSEKEITKTQNILKYSLFSKIKRFDISLIDTGGCILTMDSKNINKNLTYDILLNSLLKID
jgi:isopropylmalate/homocitrate/citramalate synthase